MENIINRIIEIDKNAIDRLNAAESKKKLLISSAKSERTQLVATALKDAESLLAKKDSAVKSVALQDLDGISLHRQADLDKLRASFDDNHEQWEAEIFAGIVGE